MDNYKLWEEYCEYCKHDGKKMYHLPFIIWLKQIKKMKTDEEEQKAGMQNDSKTAYEQIKKVSRTL